MAKQKDDIAKLSNAFSTGGGGGSFERRIQAVFLLALLVDGVSPILNMPVERLHFKRGNWGMQWTIWSSFLHPARSFCAK